MKSAKPVDIRHASAEAVRAATARDVDTTVRRWIESIVNRVECACVQDYD